MNKIFITIYLIFLSVFQVSYSQTISPLTTAEFCPGVETVFTVTLSSQGYTGLAVSGTAPNVAPAVTAIPYNVTTPTTGPSAGKTIFNFKGKFLDLNDQQTFRVQYTLNNQAGSTDFTFAKIKSFYYGDPVSQPHPSTTSIIAQRCQIQSFNISFSNVQFIIPFLNPRVPYGTNTTYEYMLPSGWKLNGATSTGNWIAGSNNVIVMSDLATGDQQSVQIRAVNSCGASLARGPIYTIPISRPAPTLTITPVTQDVICSGSRDYKINGMPAGSSVVWQVSNTSQASITNGATSQTVTITRTGTTNTVLTLKATVTHCSFSYIVTHDISLGAPQPNPIEVVLIDAAIGRIQVKSEPVIPGATQGYKWYRDGVWQSPWDIYTSTFAQIPTKRGSCGVGYGITVTATTACGVSAATYKGVFVPCDNIFRVSSNPVSESIQISVDRSKVVNSNKSSIDEVRIYDLQGILKKYVKYSRVPSTTISTQGIQNGFYVVVLTNGSFKESHKIFIQRN